MARKPIVNNKKYAGKYVALTSSGKKSVIASSFRLGAVIKKAQQQGVDSPAIVFVPKKGVASLY